MFLHYFTMSRPAKFPPKHDIFHKNLLCFAGCSLCEHEVGILNKMVGSCCYFYQLTRVNLLLLTHGFGLASSGLFKLDFYITVYGIMYCCQIRSYHQGSQRRNPIELHNIQIIILTDPQISTINLSLTKVFINNAQRIGPALRQLILL